ncbi:MAG: hypothetical protein ACLS2V_13135 [Clostridium paraputrificum]|uniref:hypothetical protein n=1 Tax=Clostridium sp. TaxID=1506 RepID=UPI0025BBA3CC|nr:hypothetical protein [Clostridium sp.]MBS5926168.1 hypothetical protein [Clostridium sp.]
MERKQLENIYLSNGIGNFQLKNLGDLMKIHGINARITEGFSELSQEDKKTYETFIINYMNMHGINSRATIYPLRIYRAFEIDYKIKEDPINDYYLKFAGEVWNCTSKDNEFIVKEWGEVENKNMPGVIEEKSDSYLRIELNEMNSELWLHIIDNGEQWY